MSQATPSRFYKYLSLGSDSREHNRHILAEASLYWRCPSAFNDPYDCAPVFRLSPSREQFRAYLKDVARERGAGLARAERQQLVTQGAKVSRLTYERALIAGNAERLAEIGICSLSEIGDDMLMWAHYADAHRGICLQFHVQPGDDYFDRALPVTYARDRPVITLPCRDMDAIIAPAFLTKADFWSYEREWRLIRPDRPPGWYRYPSGSLTAIILGARMTAEQRAGIDELAQSFDPMPALFEARFHANQFRMEIGPLER
jgi:hypothetical protein